MSGQAATERERLLVVDDEPEVVDWLVEMLVDDGYEVDGVTSPQAALERVAARDYALVITDVEMPGLRGIELMSAIHERRRGQLVLLITAFGSIDLAVRALRAGACDFVTKPFRFEVLQAAIARALRERQMRREIVRLRAALPGGEEGAGELVARSPAMAKAVELARRVALTRATVLLTGESGVGKGAIARFIHEHSGRASGPFVQLNCAALPTSLAESELFGVRRGAYTDAREDRPGFFARADGGTLLLDEVGEMPLDVQPKLLQALETDRVRPVGASSELPVNVRLLAATNRPLEAALKAQTFRLDLFYRLNVVRIEIPPLRERPEDLAALVDVLLERACKKVGRPILGLSADALRMLLRHDWPGNVRELANVLERAVVLGEHDVLVPDDVVLRTGDFAERDSLEQAARRGMALDDLATAYIAKMVEVNQGNKTEAARILGIDRRTLYRKLGGEPE